MRAAKIGAVFYILWGLVHLKAAADEFALGASLQRGLVQGKINQGAWDLLFFALLAIVVAIRWNWRNEPLGYWINLVAISAADLGFIILVLLPGYVNIFPGILGPAFWLCGAVFSTVGYRSREKK